MSRATTVTAAAAALLLGVVPSAAPGLAQAAAPRGWQRLGPSLVARAEAASAAVGSTLYVIGGLTGATTTDQVERYDTRQDRWTRVAPLPVAVNHASAVSYAGQVYVLGGYLHSISSPGVPTGGLLDTTAGFFRYDPRADRWSSMPAMPVARAAAAAAVIGNRLYVAGGRSGFPTYLTSTGLLKRLDVFDFRTGRWSRGPDMSIAREHVAGTAAGGGFYVLGGHLAFDQAAGGIASAERFVPALGRWQPVPDMRVAHNGFTALTVAGRVVVFGSEEPSTTDFETSQAAVEIFDPRVDRWAVLPDMLTPRGATAGAAIGSRVYAVEGIAAPPATVCCTGSDVVEALLVPGRRR